MPRIGAGQLAQLCRRVGMSLRAGVDLRRVWEDESRRGPARQRACAQQIARSVADGGGVAEALRDCRGFFPPLTCEMAEVGEHTGRLDEALLRLADHYDHVLRLRRTFLLAIAWPAIELTAAVVVVGVLIGAMGIIASQTGREPIDVLGIGLVGVRGVLLYALLVGLLALAVAGPAAAILTGRVAAKPMELAMRVPWLGKTLQNIALARFAWSLAMALEAGIDARRCMDIALHSTQNPFYTSHLASVDRVIISGGEYHEALRATGAFPQEFLDTLEAAELSGTQTESMAHLSEQYEQRAITSSKILAAVVAFATWGLVALLLILLIFRMFFLLYYQPIQDALNFANGR